jgi:hypothetical protein
MCPLLILTLPDSPASDLVPQEQTFLWLAGIVIFIGISPTPQSSVALQSTARLTERQVCFGAFQENKSTVCSRSVI